MPRKRKRDRDGLYRRPESPYWWVCYTDSRGRQTRRSTRTADRDQALALLARWRLEAHSRYADAEQVQYTVDDALLAYLDGPSSRKRRPDRDKWSARGIYPHFQGRALDSLTNQDMIAYQHKRIADGVGADTINREIGLLRLALHHARDALGWRVPDIHWPRMKPPPGRIRWITRAEAVALVEAARKEPDAPHLADFILLGLHTGMRRGEMLGLEWRRVDLQAGLIYLEPEHQKTARHSTVPINSHARAALLSRRAWNAEHCPASPWVFAHRSGARLQATTRSFNSVCQRVGILDFHIHDLRHTCAAWLVQAGVPLARIRDLLRHASVKQTEIYAHLAPADVADAVKALDGV